MSFNPVLAAGKTAISRKQGSVPAKALRTLLLPGEKIFDFGCGLGEDVAYFHDAGYECDGWDPVHKPHPNLRHYKEKEYDWLLCAYVLNVLPPIEREQALNTLYDVLPSWGAALVAVRSAHEVAYALENGKEWERYCDGYITSKGTFQKGFSVAELSEKLHGVGFRITEEISGRPVIVAAYKMPMTFYRRPAC